MDRFGKVTQKVRRRVTGLHAWTQMLPSQTMRLRGEASFSPTVPVGWESTAAQPASLPVPAADHPVPGGQSGSEARSLSHGSSPTRVKVGLFSPCHWRGHSSADTYQSHQWQDQVASLRSPGRRDSRSLQVGGACRWVGHAGGRGMQVGGACLSASWAYSECADFNTGVLPLFQPGPVRTAGGDFSL